LEICRKWFVLPCPHFELLIFGSSVLGGQDGVSEAMLVSKQAATLEVALISTDTLKPRLLQCNLGTWNDLWVHNSALWLVPCDLEGPRGKGLEIGPSPT
jgi:hypothetical protein